MWTFMGINILMVFIGYLELAIIRAERVYLPYLSLKRSMSRNQFWEIWTNLHVVDNSRLSPNEGLSHWLIQTHFRCPH